MSKELAKVNSDAPVLVWLTSLKGQEAQIWYTDCRSMIKEENDRITKVYQIVEVDRNLTPAELRELYPMAPSGKPEPKVAIVYPEEAEALPE